MAEDPWLRDGAELVLNRHTHSAAGGQVLLGGSPARVMMLTPRAAALVRHRTFQVTDDFSRRLAEHLLAAGMADPLPRSLAARSAAGITAVIPVYRRPVQLRRLLESISAVLPLCPVIVVDDASGDSSAEIAELAEHCGAKYVPLSENLGPGEARNAGLAQVESEFVLFVDTDVVLEPGSIDFLLRHFSDPQLAAAAPRVKGLPHTKQRWVLDYENARSSLDHGPAAGLVNPHSMLSWVSTTCLLARTAAVAEGFSSGMRVAEDVDLIWRLTGTGWRVRYEPASVVRHEHRSTVASWLARKYVYGTGAASLAQRHGDLVAPAVLAPWAGTALALTVLQRRWPLVMAGGLTCWAYIATVWKLRRLSLSPQQRCLLSARLVGLGLITALGQGINLTVRHWVPGTVIASFFSRRTRRVLLISAAFDAVWEYSRLKPGMRLLRFAAARRLDDIAYGLGVWSSAMRSGSLITALKTLGPARPIRPRSKSGPVRL